MALGGIDEQTAKAALRRLDRTHADYARQFYGADIRDPVALPPDRRLDRCRVGRLRRRDRARQRARLSSGAEAYDSCMTGLGLSLLVVGAILVAVEAHVPRLGLLGGPGVIALGAGALLAISGLGGGIAVAMVAALALVAVSAGDARAHLPQGLCGASPARAGGSRAAARPARRGAPLGRAGRQGPGRRRAVEARRSLTDDEPVGAPRRRLDRGRAARRADARGPARPRNGSWCGDRGDRDRAGRAAGARAHRRGRVGAGAARVRARRRLPPRPPDGAARPGPGDADADDRPDGSGQPANGDAHGPAAGDHHQGQRARAGDGGRLLPRGRPQQRGHRRSRASTAPRSRSRRRRCARCSAAPTSTRCCPSATASTRSSST